MHNEAFMSGYQYRIKKWDIHSQLNATHYICAVDSVPALRFYFEHPAPVSLVFPLCEKLEKNEAPHLKQNCNGGLS